MRNPRYAGRMQGKRQAVSHRLARVEVLAPKLTPPGQSYPPRRSTIVGVATVAPAAGTKQDNAAAVPSQSASLEIQHAESSQLVTPAGHPSVAGDASACPFLRALKPLPHSGMNAWQSLFSFVGSMASHANKVVSQGPGVAQDWFMMQPAVYLSDYEVIKKLAFQEGTHMRASQAEVTSDLFGKHSLVVIQDVEEHRLIRRIMAPTFTPEVLQSFFPLIQRLVREMWGDLAQTSAAGKQPFALDRLKRFAIDIIASMCLGELPKAELDFMNKNFAHFADAALFPFDWNVWPSPYYFGQQARSNLSKYLLDKINTARAELAAAEASAGHGAGHQELLGWRPMLYQLLATDETGATLTDDQIIDSLLILLYAGHDTVAMTMSNALFFIHQNTEVLEKLREEQQAIVASHGTEMSAEALKHMTYADAVIRETFRVRPTVPGSNRQAVIDLDIKGHHVPAGMQMFVCLGEAVKNDPRYPHDEGALSLDRFNPDRFLDPSILGKPGPQAYFGVGPRMCIGYHLAMYEMKIILAELARGYRYSADIGDGSTVQIPLVYPKNKLPLFVEPLALAISA